MHVDGEQHVQYYHYEEVSPGTLLSPARNTNIYGPLAQVSLAPPGIYLVIATYEALGLFKNTCYVVGPKNGYLIPSSKWRRVG